MNETDLYKRLKRVTPGFDWERHEDKFTSGIPDCSFGAQGKGGWVELKTYDCWPRNPNDPLAFTDLKATQVNWSIKRGRAQGSVWFLVAVANDWFLISWRYARKLGELTRMELLEASDVWGSFPMSREISKYLLNPYDGDVRQGELSNDTNKRRPRKRA